MIWMGKGINKILYCFFKLFNVIISITFKRRGVNNMKKFKASSVLVSVLATGIVLLSGCGKEDEVNNII